MAEPLFVTKEDYDAEVAELMRLRAEYDRKWATLRRAVSNIRRYETRILNLERRLSELRAVGWRYLKGEGRREWLRIRDTDLPTARFHLGFWTDRRETIIKEVYREREEISRLDTLIRRKVVKPPPPPEQLIGDEAITGYTIWYNPETKKYIVRHPETKEVIRIENKIVVEWTGSIETRVGHDVPMTVEITAVTAVEEFDESDIITLTREDGDYDQSLYNKTRTVFGSALLGAIRKIGIIYNGLSIVEEKKWYSFPVHDYSIAHVFFERKSRFIKLRGYHNDVDLNTHEPKECPQYRG